MRINTRAFSDHRIRANHGIRSDFHITVQNRARIDYRRFMNIRFMLFYKLQFHTISPAICYVNCMNQFRFIVYFIIRISGKYITAILRFLMQLAMSGMEIQ